MKYIALGIVSLSLIACGGASSVSVEEDDRVGSLPSSITDPSDNETTAEKVRLGKLLFWDPILSGNKDVACATCHHPDHGYAENIDLSLGVGGHGLSEERSGGVLIKRNAPTIINTAYNGIDQDGEYDPSDTVMFWDNRSNSLEHQALEPIKSADEMRGEDFTEEEIVSTVSERLSGIEEYVDLFNDAFGDYAINGERIAQAIAAFERSIVSHNSPFDRFAEGDDNALTQLQIKGLNAFVDAGCQACHSGPMFSDYELHVIALPENERLVAASIIDEGAVGDGISGAFRTPSLRNIELTAPYMHNGTLATLEEAIRLYDNISNPSNDPDLNEMEFDEVEPETITAIAAFLRSLTDESFDKTIPEQVPSGLNPGGNI